MFWKWKYLTQKSTLKFCSYILGKEEELLKQVLLLVHYKMLSVLASENCLLTIEMRILTAYNICINFFFITCWLVLRKSSSENQIYC